MHLTDGETDGQTGGRTDGFATARPPCIAAAR